MSGSPKNIMGLVLATGLIPVASSALAQTYSTCATYTSTADFQLGEFINLNATSGELRINTAQQTLEATPAVLPSIWVACSDRGTVVRMQPRSIFRRSTEQ